MKIKKNFVCSIKGCNNKFYAKGMCVRHYNQIKSSGKILSRFRNDKNEYEIYGNKVLLSIYDKNLEIIQKAIIDFDDLERIRKYKWHMLSTEYIATTLKNHKLLLLHRYITNCPDDKVVDHINHDRSDNRKINLKICTQKENTNNRKTIPKGITKIRRKNHVYYVLYLKRKYRGCFKSIEEAEKTKIKILRTENYL